MYIFKQHIRHAHLRAGHNSLLPPYGCAVPVASGTAAPPAAPSVGPIRVVSSPNCAPWYLRNRMARVLQVWESMGSVARGGGKHAGLVRDSWRGENASVTQGGGNMWV